MLPKVGPYILLSLPVHSVVLVTLSEGPRATKTLVQQEAGTVSFFVLSCNTHKQPQHNETHLIKAEGGLDFVTSCADV
jgi:hypothetical protein